MRGRWLLSERALGTGRRVSPNMKPGDDLRRRHLLYLESPNATPLRWPYQRPLYSEMRPLITNHLPAVAHSSSVVGRLWLPVISVGLIEPLL